MIPESAAAREPVGGADRRGFEAVVFARVRRRLIPFMFLLYMANYLDRVNIGFAALQMNRDLGFSPEVYGLGAGIFFWGYLLFEIPSNLIMERVGARMSMARIMIVWGIVSTSMMFMRSATTWYVLRFLLGVAEAGFFPGMILYLTYWFPASERAKTVALFMTATAVAGVIGGPVSGALLELNGVFGLAGWQWLFLMEGVPSIVLGLVAFFYLTDRPERADWLTPQQRAWLIARMQADREEHDTSRRATRVAALASPRVWLFSILYFCIVVCFYGVVFFLPQILRNLSGFRDVTIGFISAMPSIAAAVTMVAVGASSDRTGERHVHLAASAVVGACGLVLAAAVKQPLPALFALSIAAAGIWGTLGPFWALPTDYLQSTAAAGGIALINSVGNLGGFVGPAVVGFIVGATGSFARALLAIAGSLLVACLLAMGLRASASATRRDGRR
jgi:ACS family tartrate transporter-like MFS transporter